MAPPLPDIDWNNMPEAVINPSSALAKREESMSVAPECVTRCLGRGVVGECSTLDNHGCLCENLGYKTSVMTCWNLICTKGEYTAGLAYIVAMCQAAGVILGDPATQILPGAGPSATDITTPPVLYSQAAFNIQAVMSAICSAVLAVALIALYYSCNKHAKRERDMTQRSHQFTTKSNPYLGGAAPSRHHISTIDMGDTVGMNDMFTSQYPRRSGARFTNRLAVTSEKLEEEWEMKESPSPMGEKDAMRADFNSDEAEGDKFFTAPTRGTSDAPGSPFTATTSYTEYTSAGASRSEYDSTAHLMRHANRADSDDEVAMTSEQREAAQARENAAREARAESSDANEAGPGPSTVEAMKEAEVPGSNDEDNSYHAISPPPSAPAATASRMPVTPPPAYIVPSSARPFDTPPKSE